MDLPIIRIELDSMKQRISSMLAERNDEFTTMIEQSLNEQLTVENLQDQIDYQVKEAIQRAILDLGTNHCIRVAVRQSLEQMIVEKLAGESE